MMSGQRDSQIDIQSDLLTSKQSALAILQQTLRKQLPVSIKLSLGPLLFVFLLSSYMQIKGGVL